METIKKFAKLMLKNKKNFSSAKSNLDSFIEKNDLQFSKMEFEKLKSILTSTNNIEFKNFYSKEFEKGINIMDMPDVSFFK